MCSKPFSNDQVHMMQLYVRKATCTHTAVKGMHMRIHCHSQWHYIYSSFHTCYIYKIHTIHALILCGCGKLQEMYVHTHSRKACNCECLTHTAIQDRCTCIHTVGMTTVHLTGHSSTVGLALSGAHTTTHCELHGTSKED